MTLTQADAAQGVTLLLVSTTTMRPLIEVPYMSANLSDGLNDPGSATSRSTSRSTRRSTR